VDNGITIISKYVPTTVPTGRLIGRFDPRETIDEDMQYSVMDDANIKLSDNLTDDQYFDEMQSLLYFMSVPSTPMRTIVNTYINLFKNKYTGDYFSADLSTNVMNNKTMVNTIKRFGEDLSTRLSSVNGDIDAISEYQISNLFRPTFNEGSDYSQGFTILINDIEKGDVKLVDNTYTYIASTKQWTGTFYFDITDHFGLDKDDAIQYQSIPVYGDGFAAWWRLQHRRSYPPFKTKLRVVATITGKVP
jgi:hypothetical protein